jgi:hypothetical protein
MVERAVMVTDKAKLERDKNTITLEAVPPGQLETRISPTAKKEADQIPFPKANPRKA